MVVLYNCGSLSEGLLNKRISECGSVVAVDGEDESDLGLARKECREMVKVPTAEEGGREWAETIRRLRSGFVMKWKASDCSVCENSGGKCGFDDSTLHFKYFCPDRAHVWQCRISGMFDTLFL